MFFLANCSFHIIWEYNSNKQLHMREYSMEYFKKNQFLVYMKIFGASLEYSASLGWWTKDIFLDHFYAMPPPPPVYRSHVYGQRAQV